MSLLKLGNWYKRIFHGGCLTFPLYLKVFLITWAHALTDTGITSLHNWTPLSPSNPIFSWERKWKLLSRVWLFSTPWTVAPGSWVRGILQTRMLEWVGIPFSRGSSQSKDRTCLLQCSQILYHMSHQGIITKAYHGPSSIIPAPSA